MKTYKLTNGIEMPAIGMGTWPLKGDRLRSVATTAIEVGYRLFDTADNYDNEEALGDVLNSGIVSREELFVTTKISDEKNDACPWSSVGKNFYRTSAYMKTHTVKEAVERLVNESLWKLRTDYIDCLLVHWPYPDYLLEIWDVMCGLYHQGKLRSIGVSNCRERHIEKISRAFDIKPMVNQISISPLDTRKPLLSYCGRQGIRVMCYGPLRQMNNPMVSQNRHVKEILQRHGITIGQLLLAWNVRQGIVPIPKSSSRKRLEENLDVFDIRLTEEEMEWLSSLNVNLQYLPESMFCPGL